VSGNLAGKVNQERHWTEEMAKLLLDEVQSFTLEYLDNSFQRNSHGIEKLNPSTRLSVQHAWFVHQYETEYNPIHTHDESMISCVGYLKLPEGIEKEWEQDDNSHKLSSHGHIAFYHGLGHDNGFTVRPRVGDFYVFPSNLSHCVYPFYTKGERRSFSANFNFSP